MLQQEPGGSFVGLSDRSRCRLFLWLSSLVLSCSCAHLIGSRCLVGPVASRWSSLFSRSCRLRFSPCPIRGYRIVLLADPSCVDLVAHSVFVRLSNLLLVHCSKSVMPKTQPQRRRSSRVQAVAQQAATGGQVSTSTTSASRPDPVSVSASMLSSAGVSSTIASVQSFDLRSTSVASLTLEELL